MGAVKSGLSPGWRGMVGVALFAVLVVLAACGGGDNSGGGSAQGQQQPATLKVGVIPIADVAPLYLGRQKGFFKQEKLTIKPVPAEGGAAIVPAVLAGDDQIGFSNVTSLVIATSKKLPVQIISQGVMAGKGGDDAFSAVLVPKDSSIRSAKDLAGKTVSVNNLNNVGPLTINTVLEKNGVDPKQVKYTEVPFPDAVGALKAHRVDASFVVEPFQSAGRAAGDRILFHPFEETAPHYSVATYFASKQYIAQNPGVVDRFVRAMNKSLDYAEQHPDEVRKIVTTYTPIPAKAAEKMVLPHWSSGLQRDSIQQTINLSKKYGYIEQAPSLGDLIYTPGSS
jgi:NitT/TauT family transport system substrate-binding protein